MRTEVSPPIPNHFILPATLSKTITFRQIPLQSQKWYLHDMPIWVSLVRSGETSSSLAYDDEEEKTPPLKKKKR
ncbi:unnamed protein product [Ilex paraguariensis]|uniref:Uncharacterized protein n=1 Tax=Ilex paraguariensis TaxID=185542 RepID=A0ABC8TX90_9AQUA